MCGDNGLVGLANLNKPEETPPFSGLGISVDDVSYELSDWEVIENGQWRMRFLFTVPPSATADIARAGRISVQAMQPGGTFFGFTGETEDERISEIAESCSVAPATSQSSLELFFDTDIVGGDISAEGYRPATLDQCEEICRSISQCVAISFIPERQWCWPKRGVSSTTTRKGVVSAWVRQ
jgi:hypothetical protein